jgi:hypothetical protein
MNKINWISIDKYKPPKPDWYLAGLPENNKEEITRTVEICWWNGAQFSRDETGEYGVRTYYTHWSFLPKPPKSK